MAETKTFLEWLSSVDKWEAQEEAELRKEMGLDNVKNCEQLLSPLRFYCEHMPLSLQFTLVST